MGSETHGLRRVTCRNCNTKYGYVPGGYKSLKNCPSCAPDLWRIDANV